MNPDSENTSTFDPSLAEIPGLTWLPWVGSNYAKMPDGRRVLIVGESHYTDEKNPEKIEQSIQTISRRTFTREVLQESMIDKCEHRTFVTMDKLFLSPKDRVVFWADFCFYNFVQRPMNDKRKRPTWDDFCKGWEVFLDVVENLRPDHVLFIGVEASKHFNGFMARNNREHIGVEKVKKVGSAYARTACFKVEGTEVPLHFIKHCGKCFPTDAWRNYLQRNTGGLMACIAASAGVVLPSEN